MTLQEIKLKIMQDAKLTEVELNARIKKKMDQLAGLISQEGACHIIANELGVKLQLQTSGRMKIKNILPGMRNFEILAKVLKIYETRNFDKGERKGKVANILTGDETGLMRIVFWNDYVDKISSFKENDILLLKGGYVKDNQGKKELHLNDQSELSVNPPGESVIVAPQAQQEMKRKKIVDIVDDENNVEILGTVVQVYDPRFFEVCPSCKKRTRMQDSERFVCEEHGQITPAYSYVMNVMVDDGSESIRVVCFKEMAEKLLSKTEQEILYYKDNAVEFENAKNTILAKIMKFQGRVKKNLMFDRIEFTAQTIDVNPNPEEELKRIKA